MSSRLLFLLLWISLGHVLSFKISVQRLSGLHQGPTRRFSEEKEGKTKNSNVDLFAVTKQKKALVAAPAPIEALVPPTPAPPSSTSSVSPSTLIGQQSKNALKAEELRLEAELEQIVVDEASLGQRTKRLVEIDRLLLQVITEKTLTLTELVSSHKSLVGKEMYFRIAELANNARGGAEKQALTQLCDDLLQAAKAADPLLHAELTSDIEKEFNAGLPVAGNGGVDGGVMGGMGGGGMYDQALQQLLRQANLSQSGANNETRGQLPPGIPPGFIAPGLFGLNSTAPSTFGVDGPLRPPGSRAMVRFPSAVPFNLLPLMLRSPELSEEDFAILRDTVFTSDVLSRCVADHSVFLATFRGEPPAGSNIQDVYAKAKARIELVPGMADRVRLFLLPEYRLSATASANNTLTEPYGGQKFEPVLMVMSRQAVPKLAGVEYPAVLLSALATFATCFLYATDVNSLNQDFVARAVAGDETVVGKVFAVLNGLLVLQLAHEAGHAAAAFSHKLKLGPPFLVPSLQVGLFGSVTRLLNFPPSRKSLFDVAIAGPLVGLIYSLVLFVFGLDQTAQASPELLAGFPALPTGFFGSSFLLFQLTDNYLHIADAAKVATSLTPVHPDVIIGMTGLLINSYNLLPIGRLDGGRIAMAVAGRQAAQRISLAALVGQGFALLTSNFSPVLLAWLLTVLFLQRGPDLPPEDDVTAVGSKEEGAAGPVWAGRLAALIFCSIVAGLVLLPIPVDPNSLTLPQPTLGGLSGLGLTGGSSLL